MKIRTDRAELAAALAWVASVISKNPQVATLVGLRITAEADQITLAATDYDASHTAHVAAEVIESGDVLAPGFFVRSLVGSLRSKDVELIHDKNELTITGGRSTYQTRTLNLADYPSLPTPPASVGTIDAGDLAAAVATVMPPIDDGSPHEQVRGLRMEATDGILWLVGMDRFRVAAVELPWSGSDFKTTVQAKGSYAAVKGMTGAVNLGIKDGSLGLSDARRTVVLRTFNEGFTPIWPTLIATTEGPSAKLDAADFLTAIRRAGGLTEKTDWIEVTFGGGELRIDVDVTEVGAGSDVLDAETTDSASGRLDAAYLADALGVIAGGTVTITRPPGNGPWLITPDDYSHIRLAVMGKNGKA